MNKAKPRRMLLSIAGGSAAVLSMQTVACFKDTDALGTILRPPDVCERDGALPACRDAQGYTRDAQPVHDASIVNDARFADPGDATPDAAGPPPDAGDAE